MADNFDWWPYWNRILRAADAAKVADLAVVAGGAVGGAGGALIGTAIVPGIGTVLGAMVGVLWRLLEPLLPTTLRNSRSTATYLRWIILLANSTLKNYIGLLTDICHWTS